MKHGDGEELAEQMNFHKTMKGLKPKQVEAFWLAHHKFKADEKRKKAAEAENGIILSYKCGDGYHPNGNWEPRNRETRGRNIKPKWCGSTSGWTHIKSYDDLLQFSKCCFCGFDNKEQVQRDLLHSAAKAQQSLEIDTKRYAHFLAITSAMK